MDTIKGDRDNLATEVAELRARLTFLEKKEKEKTSNELLLRRYEQHVLEKSDNAIRIRDATISDLAARLEHALDTLVQEREKQRQRRQIIFPVRSANSEGRHGEELEMDLRSTKEALRNSQATIESMKLEAQKREVAWMLRIKQLEQQLDLVRRENGNPVVT